MVDSTQRQIADLRNKIDELEKQPGTSRLIQRLKQRIDNIKKTAEKKKKGEEHSRGKKR